VTRVFDAFTYGTPLAIKEVTLRPVISIDFDAVFPAFTTCSRVGTVPTVVAVVILLMRPFPSTVITGVNPLDPKVPGVALVVEVNFQAFPE
jgi:hypothetical protein